MGFDDRPSARTARHTTGRTGGPRASRLRAPRRSCAAGRCAESRPAARASRANAALQGCLARTCLGSARRWRTRRRAAAARGDWCAVGSGAGGAAVGPGVSGAVAAAVWVRSRCRLRARRCRALRARLVRVASRAAAVSRVPAPAIASSRTARPSSRWGVACPPVVCAAIGIVSFSGGFAVGRVCGRRARPCARIWRCAWLV